MWERQPSFSCGFSFGYWTEGREDFGERSQRLLVIWFCRDPRDCCQLGAFCWLIYVYLPAPRSQLLPHQNMAWPVSFSFYLSLYLYINRPSKPHPHNSSASGGRELNNNWVGWSSLMENISVWSVLSNKEFNSIHSCVLKFYQNILLRIKNRNWVVV